METGTDLIDNTSADVHALMEGQSVQDGTHIHYETFGDIQGDERDIALTILDHFNVYDINTIGKFSACAQSKSTETVDAFLKHTQSEDFEKVSEILKSTVSTAKGLNIEKYTNNSTVNRVRRVFKKNPIETLKEECQGTLGQIESLVNSLNDHKVKLYQDVESLRYIYEEALVNFKSINFYKVIGEEEQRYVNEELLPRLREEASQNRNDVSKQEELARVQQFADELDRRLYDLLSIMEIFKTTLPKIRGHMSTNNFLAHKIDSVSYSALSIWKTEIANAVATQTTQSAVKATESATNFTNELVRKTSRSMLDTVRDTLSAVERPLIDPETLQAVTNDFVEVAQITNQAAKEANKDRDEARQRIEKMSNERREKVNHIKKTHEQNLRDGNDGRRKPLGKRLGNS